MALNLQYERLDKYLVIRSYGMGKSLQDYQEYAAMAADFADSEDYDRLLMDDTQSRIFVDEQTAKNLANWLLDKNMLDRWQRIAVVCVKEDLRIGLIFEDFAREHGMEFSAFTDIELASAWLEAD